MITSRQIKQPESSLVLEYLLLHNGRKNLPEPIHLVRKTPEMFDFYETNILPEPKIISKYLGMVKRHTDSEPGFSTPKGVI